MQLSSPKIEMQMAMGKIEAGFESVRIENTMKRYENV